MLRDTYIQFADVLEVLVEGLDHVVDELEERELVDVVVDVDADDEVETGVAAVDHFVLPMLQERALHENGSAYGDEGTYLVLGAGQALAD